MHNDSDGTRRLSFPLLVTVLICFAFAAVALVYWFANPFRVPHELQVLDQRQLEDGSLLVLAQRYNRSLGEPSTITVYQKIQSNLWIGYYVDHEARYWRSGRLDSKDKESSQFTVFRGDVPVAEIDCSHYRSAPIENPQAIRKAYLVDQSPMENPARRPQSLGDYKGGN